MRTLCTAGLIAMTLIAAGCAQEPLRTTQVSDQLLGEMDKGAQRAKPRESDAVNQALLPPLRMELPQAQGRPIEGRFDLNVNNAPAREVFLSIVSGTRYSMLVHPDVSGSISVNLKDVSLSEALEAIREIYGYEYKIDGSRVYIQPAGLHTRVFQVNYLIGARQGRSDMRVTAGSSGIATGAASANTTTTTITSTQTQVVAPTTPAGVPGPPSLSPNSAGALGGIAADATRMSTVQLTDFWAEVAYAIRTVVGTGEGRSIVISPQSGVVVVRAMPQELRSVEALLKAMKLSVERQVMLEAKIIDVTLNKGYQAGINWAAFPTSGIAAGFSSTQTTANPSSLSPTGPLSASSSGAPSAGPSTSSTFLANPAAKTLSGISGTAIAGAAGGVFGLAVQTRNFAAMLQFLESQGTVQVLSSPRVATLNNQKAVLKVGTDQPFVTSINPGNASPVTNAGVTSFVTTFTPIINNIFAGISLDVTPQIDASGNIILHIHPLVTSVSGTPLTFNLGAGEQSITVAKIDVSESDTMVRTSDGNIVVLGGLMKVLLDNSRNGIPGLADAPLIGGAFRNSATGTTKRELVILIKPTIIDSDKEWEHDILDARGRMQDIGNGPEYRPADRRQ